MGRKSVEIYRGQRGKEKAELFKRFRLRVIADLYKKKFFSLFDHRCFKCGSKEKSQQEFGRPPILCIDHHIPMARGGHLVPGNLVSLCRSCNNKKLDYPPEDFYTPSELERLKPILERQIELFSFKFDFDAWGEDREGYFLRLGIDADLVHELLFNPDHPDFIGAAPENDGLIISVTLKS
ncbi:MAG TPA: hypothetical protein DFK12_11750 [Gallionellaceae bacterium]|nr:hypothetical protein [Gallionellaceae bacterium]